MDAPHAALSKITALVYPGKVVVSSVDLVADYPRAKIFHCDCATKYPEACVGIAEDGRIEILLGKGRDTLRSAPLSLPTVIEISGLPEGNWTAEAWVYGYSVYMACWLPPEELVSLWQRDREASWRGIPAEVVQGILTGDPEPSFG